MLHTNDLTLANLQEIVDYIKTNASTISALNVSNIVGLQSSLDLKAPLNNPNFTGVVNGVFNGNITGNASTATNASTVPITNNSAEIATTAAVHGIFSLNGIVLTITA